MNSAAEHQHLFIDNCPINVNSLSRNDTSFFSSWGPEALILTLLAKAWRWCPLQGRSGTFPADWWHFPETLIRRLTDLASWPGCASVDGRLSLAQMARILLNELALKFIVDFTRLRGWSAGAGDRSDKLVRTSRQSRLICIISRLVRWKMRHYSSMFQEQNRRHGRETVPLSADLFEEHDVGEILLNFGCSASGGWI